MPPFHLPQNKCYGVIKYEKLNYSHRILNIPKINFYFFIFFFYFFFLEKKRLVREEKVVRAPTRTTSVNLFGLIMIGIFSFRLLMGAKVRQL